MVLPLEFTPTYLHLNIKPTLQAYACSMSKAFMEPPLAWHVSLFFTRGDTGIARVHASKCSCPYPTSSACFTFSTAKLGPADTLLPRGDPTRFEHLFEAPGTSAADRSKHCAEPRSASCPGTLTFAGESMAKTGPLSDIAPNLCAESRESCPKQSPPPLSSSSGVELHSYGRGGSDLRNKPHSTSDLSTPVTPDSGEKPPMSVTLPTVPPPADQRNVEYPTQPRLNADIAELRDTCDLTRAITYDSEYAFAHGGFSDVYLGDWVATHVGAKGIVVEDHVAIVIKAIRAYTRDRLDFARARRIAINCAQRLNREVNILRRLSHPNIAEFLGIAFKQELRPCIVIKYYKNGITPKYLELNPKADRLALIKDIANGLRYLHTLEPPIVHGDLKGCNTLVTDDGRAIITDFGLSRIIEEYSAPTGFTTTTFGGSIRHCAPELLFDPTVDSDDEDSDQEDDGIARNPTLHSDIWGLACVAYELFTGLNPYPDDRYDWNIVKSFTSRQIPSAKRVSDGRDRWLKKSTQVFNLLCRCWSFTPSSRPTIQVITQELQNAAMTAEGGF